MKNTSYWLSLIFIILFATSTKAQYPLLESIYPSTNSSLNEVLYAGNGNWITAYRLGEFAIQLEKTNSIGNTIWQHKLVTDTFQYSNNSNTVPSFEMIQTKDQEIIVAISMDWWCHVFGSNFTSLIKLDSLGNMVWTYKAGPNINQYSNLLALPSSNILASFSSYLYEFDSSGALIDSSDYSMGDILNLNLGSNHTILLACEDGIIRLDSLGNTQDSAFWPNPVSDFLSFNGSSFLIRVNQKIYLMDSDLNTIDSLSIPVDYTTFIDLIPNLPEGVWLIGEKKAGLISPLFQLQSEFNFNLPANILPSATALSSEHIMLGATTITQSNALPVIKSFAKNGNTLNDSLDLGIESVTFNSFQYDFLDIGYISSNLTVTVINTGTVPVDSFYLSTQDCDYGVGCGGPEDYVGIKSLIPIQHSQLMPGDTAQITIACQDFKTSLDDTSYTFCVWVSSPNNRIDRNLDNDHSCEMISLTSINESAFPQIPLTIFPNPASDYVWIEAETTLERITLMDIQGRIILDFQPFPGKSSFKLDLPSLPEGIYLLNVQSQEGAGMTKLLIK